MKLEKAAHGFSGFNALTPYCFHRTAPLPKMYFICLGKRWIKAENPLYNFIFVHLKCEHNAYKCSKFKRNREAGIPLFLGPDSYSQRGSPSPTLCISNPRGMLHPHALTRAEPNHLTCNSAADVP